MDIEVRYATPHLPSQKRGSLIIATSDEEEGRGKKGPKAKTVECLVKLSIDWDLAGRDYLEREIGRWPRWRRQQGSFLLHPMYCSVPHQAGRLAPSWSRSATSVSLWRVSYALLEGNTGNTREMLTPN